MVKTQKIDYLEELGAEDGSRFMLLAERKPKWILLLLLLRKHVRLSMRAARKMLSMNYNQLRKAVRYLSGMPDEKATRPFISTTRAKPLINVEMISYNEKYLVLTEYGKEFADKVILFLKRVALMYGRVSPEDLGISRAEFEVVVARRLAEQGIKDVKTYIDRVVDWGKLARNLALTQPILLRVMDPGALGFIPIEIETASRTRYTLYLVPP